MWVSLAMSGEILGVIGQNPSASKSNRLNVVNLRVGFYWFEVNCIDTSRMIGNFPKVSNFNQLFFKLVTIYY